jgi:hypothetical protein
MTEATISFVSAKAGAKLLLKQDEERNTDAYGKTKTSFAYGETAFFRVYAEYPDRISVFTSDGILTPMGIFTEDVADETCIFLDGTSCDTQKPVATLTGFEWMGSSLGTVTRKNAFSIQCATEPNPSQGLLGAALVSYRSAYALFGITLSHKEKDTYPVVVYAEALNG